MPITGLVVMIIVLAATALHIHSIYLIVDRQLYRLDTSNIVIGFGCGLIALISHNASSPDYASAMSVIGTAAAVYAALESRGTLHTAQ